MTRHFKAWAVLFLLLVYWFHPILSQDNVDWTYPQLFQGTMLEASYIPSAIKSITHINITFGGASTATQTLSPAINPSASLLLFGGSRSGDTSSGVYNQSNFSYAGITNSTTVTATAGASLGSNGHWVGEVIEFLPNFVKSQGCGVISWAESTPGTLGGTATITSVNTAKTTVAFEGWTTTSGATYVFDGVSQSSSQTTPQVVLTNATTITASKDSANGAWTAAVGYCYIEMK